MQQQGSLGVLGRVCDGPLAHLVRMHPPGAGHDLGVPGLAAAHTRLTRLRDAQRRHYARGVTSEPHFSGNTKNMG